jgi:hypothetical protein
MDMATHRHAALGVAIGIAGLMTTAAFAQVPPASAVPPQGQMAYQNGGIGEEQANQMREMSAQFPVRFTFSRHNGTHNTDEFLADVSLRVVDSAGRTVLNLASQGPIFLLRLPDGAYTVEAEHNGELKSRRFEIGAGRHQDIAFSWAG